MDGEKKKKEKKKNRKKEKKIEKKEKKKWMVTQIYIALDFPLYSFLVLPTAKY